MSGVKHLGKEIVDGGMRLIDEEAAVYGSPAAVVLANGRMFEMIGKMADAVSADPIRRMAAHQMGRCIVGILYGADHRKVLERAMADLFAVSPVVDLQARRQEEIKRQSDGDEIERKIGEAIEGFREAAE
jgi:hypothetical protein